MGLFDRLKRSKPDVSKAAASSPPAPQRPPTEISTITHGGVTLRIPFKWTKVDEPGEPGSIEYRNEAMRDQLFITARPFAKRLNPSEVREAVVQLAELSRKAIMKLSKGAATTSELDVREGHGQAEARLYGHDKAVQVACLHRADTGRAVSVSFYRYQLALNLEVFAGMAFDFVAFEPTPP